MKLVTNTQNIDRIHIDTISKGAIYDAIDDLILKKRDRTNLIDSVHGDFESHPKRTIKTNRLAIEIIEDQQELLKMIDRAAVWSVVIRL